MNTDIDIQADSEDGQVVYLNARIRRNYDERFYTMFSCAALQLAENSRPAAYYRVLLWACATLDGIQWRRVSGPDIATALGIGIATVRRVMPMLIDDGVLMVRHSSDGLPSYRVSDRVAWMSSAGRRAAERSEGRADPELFARDPEPDHGR